MSETPGFNLHAVMARRFSLLLFPSLFLTCALASAETKLSWWDIQRRGANGDANEGSIEWFRAAADAGIEYIRLSPAGMKSDSKDFLIGDIDGYSGIQESDLERFVEVLDRAHEVGIRIVPTFFGLPGARWKQHNNDKLDYRLWNDFAFHEQCAQFWADLAARLNDHAAIAAYNILNEPHPEREDGFQSSETRGFTEWTEKSEGTPADLDLFYETVIAAIRKVDPETPIMLDARFHANAKGFKFFKPARDQKTLYAFHCYDPWAFSTFRINKGRFSYPDRMPRGWGDETESWTRENISRLFQPVREWAKENGIPASRIAAAEFGCDRRIPGAQLYLKDLIHVFNEESWHWAFYSFRSGSWDGMDYELGTEKLNWKYWQGIEAGKTHNESVNRHDNPLWEVILNGLGKKD